MCNVCPYWNFYSVTNFSNVCEGVLSENTFEMETFWVLCVPGNWNIMDVNELYISYASVESFIEYFIFQKSVIIARLTFRF